MPGKTLIATRRIDRSSDQITGLFHVPVDSPWFYGHFPSHPILPAIALIDLVKRMLDDREGKDGTPLSIRQLKRVRFRQIVRPGEDIFVAVTPEKKADGGRYRFKISSPNKADKAVADGLVLTVDPGIFPHSGLPPGEKGGGKLVHDIAKYLPHRDPVKLVNAIVVQDGSDEKGVTARVKESWPLYRNDKGVSPIVIIELVAQATAVMMGLEEEGSDEGNMNLGYIVGIKAAKWADQYIQLGTELIIKAVKERWQDNYGIFHGSVYDSQQCYGEVHVQVFRPDPAHKL